MIDINVSISQGDNSLLAYNTLVKILHLIPSIAPTFGGPSQAIIEMIHALRSNGVNAEIATTNNGGEKLLNVPTSVCIDYEGVPVWFFPCFFPKSQAIRQFVFSAEFKNWLSHNISNYDLIHIHGLFNYASTTAMRIARSKNIPYIVRPLGQLCKWSLQQGRLKKIAYLKVIDRGNLNACSSFHLTARQEQKELTCLDLKVNSFILPHGLSIPDRIPDAYNKLRIKLQLSEDEPIVLFLSRIHRKKGLDYLIQALDKLREKHFTFVLAGSGDSTYELEVDKLLKKHNLYSNTIKTGFVEGEFKNLLLQGADLFALTSYSENFGVAVLEAIAAGTPALTTPGVALSSLLEKENLGYVAELDIDKIALSLEYILSHPEEAQEKGDRARKFINDNYTWDSVSLKMIDVYQKILNQ